MTTECKPEMTRAEVDSQQIRVLQARIKQLQAEVIVYQQVEEVLVAARLVSKSKIEEAHSIVDHLRNAVSATAEQT